MLKTKKNLVISIVMALLIVAPPLVGPLLKQAAALQTDPTFHMNWSAYQGKNGALFVSGQGFYESYLTYNATSSQAVGKSSYQNNRVFYAPDSLAANEKMDISNACSLDLFAQVDPGNPGSAVISAVNRGVETAPASSPFPCNASTVTEAANKIKGKTFAVTQTDKYQDPSTATESADKKAVVVRSHPLLAGSTIESKIEDYTLPEKDTITLYQSDGTTEIQKIETTTKNAQDGSATSAAWVYFEAQFENINPGNYVACSSLIAKCSPFAKVKDIVASVDIRGDETTAIASDANTGDALNCNLGWNPLNWLFCGLINAAQSGIQWFDEQLQGILTIPTDKFMNENVAAGNGNVGSNFYKAWDSFRILSLAILVIAGLVMIISQAIGLSIFEAYTIKRLLPRILMAAILIALSWPLMKFAINLTNVVGKDVSQLIAAPFNSYGPVDIWSGTGTLGAIGLVGGFVALGGLGMLSILLTALLGLILAVAILSLRLVIIAMLIVLAPVAIACSILPNTQKAWSMWWDFFSKALIVFPIITAFITMGRVFAVVSNDIFGGTPYGNLVAIIAYFGPYFALPAAIRLAGGALANISGIVNDRSRGVFDRMKKYRQEQPAKRAAQARAGQLYSGNKYIPYSQRAANRMNAITRGAGTGIKGGFGIGDRGAVANHQAIETTANELMKSTGFQSIMNNDDALHAGTYDSEQAARAALSKRFNGDEARVNRAVNAYKGAGFSFGDRSAQFAAAKQLVSTGTGYDNMEDMVGTLGRVSHGNASTASSLAGFANSETKARGRHDLAPSYGNLSSLVKQSAGVELGSSEKRVTMADSKREAWASGSLYQHANDKPANMKNHGEHFTTQFTSGGAKGKQEAAVYYKELEAMLPNSVGKVRDEILKQRETLEAAGMSDYLKSAVTDADGNAVMGTYNVRDDSVPGGMREAQRPLTQADVAQKNARTYERVDPNRLVDQ